MHRFIDGEDRMQQALLPHSLEDYVSEQSPARVMEVFIEELALAVLVFSGMTPAPTGRPAYHPSTLLKIYLYGYLNRLQSSRRLEREAQRNIELMWLGGRLAPDFKTIADFRKDNGAAIRAVCRQFVELCRQLGLFTRAVVAIDGSKFKAVNNRDKNYTVAKVAGLMEQVEASIARYLRALDRTDREESDIAEAKSVRLKEKIAGLRRQMQALKVIEQTVQDAPDQQVSLTDPDARSMATSGKGTDTVGYNVQIAVDAEHHLIVAHEVINQGYDRHQLAPMALKAQQARPWLRLHVPLIEPDMQISRIRLSDKTSRLRPRRAAPPTGQTYEPEVPVEVREWICPASASPDLVFGPQPPAQPHRCVAVERAIGRG